MTAQEIAVQAGSCKLSGLWRPAPSSPHGKRPLIVAIHGGTFTSKYFDLPGFSLLNAAHAAGFPILALDRPCYGKSEGVAPADTTFDRNAEILRDAIGNFCQSQGAGLPGVVLIGHSIGGAISLIVSGLRKQWRLLGVGVSGIGLAAPPHITEAWKSVPDIPSISMPPDIRRQVMFGPDWSYESAARELCMSEYHPIPRPELMEVVLGWPKNVSAVAAKITVPVQYIHAEFDGLWEATPKTISDMKAALSSSPRVEADLYQNVGHCIDFHHLGPALQMRQLAFALECAEAANRK